MDLSQVSDDDLIQMFMQESKAALGGGQAQAPAQTPSASMSAPVQRGGMVNTGLNMGGMQNVNLEGKRAVGQLENELAVQKAAELEKMKGPAGDIAGRIALARESLGNIQKIKQSLFPDGTPQSFDRGLAWQSNLKSTPVVGAVMPSARPDNPIDPTDDQAASKAQDVFRQMGSSLSGRQLIQTGVAARPEETERLVEQFAPGAISSGESAFNALAQLENFYKDYLKINDPKGVKGFSEDVDKDPLGIR